MKTKLILSGLMIAISWVGMAQVNDQVPQLGYKGQGLIQYFARSLRYPSELDSCDKSRILVAVNFKLNASGKITFAEVTGNIGDSTKKYLKEVILKTSGHWKPRRVNGKAVASNLMVLPILFKMSNCRIEYPTVFQEELDKSVEQVFKFASDGQNCTIFDLFTVVGYRIAESDTSGLPKK
ncbi:MAG: hypothetical protein H7Z75_00640 [Ferruginibacter sp.]|nr:hypothetical protein [Cytophagales bacterium]